MTDTHSAAQTAGKRGARQPLDSKALVHMLTDAKKLVAAFQRALKQVSPKLSMRDYTILARLHAGESGEVAEEGETTAKKQAKARKSTTASLQQSGLVTDNGGGQPTVTDQGRKVLAEMDAMLAGVLSAMGGKKGAATKAGSRNVPMALKAVKRTTRATGGERAGGKAGRRRKAAAEDAGAPGRA